MNWLERAQREISETHEAHPANTAERNLTTVMAVPNPDVCEKSKVAASDATTKLAECQTLYLGSVPQPYLDGWARLQSQRPAAIPQLQWRQAVDSAGRFLDEWGSLTETFGWSPGDLFDVPHDGRPGGVAWFLIGERVRALGPEHAITTSGRVFDRRQGGSHGG
jgi:hypothetical protein